MAASPSRWVVVDATSPRITYENGRTDDSSWSTYKLPSNQPRVAHGLPYNYTLHTARGSFRLSFEFEGRGVQFYAVNSLSGDVHITCYVDDIEIPIPEWHGQTPEDNTNANWLFCGRDDLDDKAHNLTVSGFINTTEHLVFDKIHYLPSANTSRKNEAVVVDNTDPSVAYSGKWEEMKGPYSYTSQYGAMLNVEFTGVSLKWFYTIPANMSNIPSTGAYTIDDGPLHPIYLSGRTGENATFENQLLFETPTLPMGQHKVSVIYSGDRDHTPLTLDYLVIQNRTLPTQNGPQSSDSSTSKSDSKSLGPIIGGIVCCLIVVASIVVAIIYRTRGRRTKRRPHLDRRHRDSGGPESPSKPSTKRTSLDTNHSLVSNKSGDDGLPTVDASQPSSHGSNRTRGAASVPGGGPTRNPPLGVGDGPPEYSRH